MSQTDKLNGSATDLCRCEQPREAWREGGASVSSENLPRHDEGRGQQGQSVPIFSIDPRGGISRFPSWDLVVCQLILQGAAVQNSAARQDLPSERSASSQ